MGNTFAWPVPDYPPQTPTSFSVSDLRTKLLERGIVSKEAAVEKHLDQDLLGRACDAYLQVLLWFEPNAITGVVCYEALWYWMRQCNAALLLV